MKGRTSRAVFAGSLAGVRLASKSYEPSLMKRSAIDQGLAAGGSFLSGFVTASGASLVVEMLPGFASAPLMRIAGFVATGSRTARSFAGSELVGEAIDPEQAGWLEFGSEVLSAVALSRVLTYDGSKIGKAAAIAAYGVSTGVDMSNALATRDDRPDPQYIATSAGVALGANAAVGAIVGVVRLGGWLPGLAFKSRPILRSIVSIGGSASVGTAVVFAGKTAMTNAFGKIAAGNRATEIAYSDTPSSPQVSGGPASQIAYESLGVQGRRLVSEVTSTDDIATLMGEAPRSHPVRAYVGIDSAETEDALVDAAIADLDAMGGFDRSIIIAAAPAGTGYVNYIAVEAAELMSRGDCATIAVQYGSLPSMLSLNKVEKASRIYAALLTRLRNELETRSSSAQLVAYGESLGALAGQAGVERASADDQLIVDRGLWVGTPKGSALFNRLTESGTPVFDSPADLAELVQVQDAPPYLFLNHDNDPVTKFDAADLYVMPSWLKDPDRGRGTNPSQRWIPGVAFFQGLIDTKNAATVIPGEFYSTGHDYRADLASFVQVAFGFDDVSTEQMERIEARLRTSEVARSEGIALGKLHTT